MKFLWPETLWLLLALPVLAGGYVVLLRRRKKVALRYASLALVKEAMGAGESVRRHVPPLLILLALTAMLFAASRPVAVVTLPSQHETIILAMDVSGSMRATDVQPNRLAASQAAAKAFVAEQPLTTRIGVVAFAATASLVQTPTRNREDIIASIDRFQLQRGTAIGSGIIVSLATLFPDAGIEVSKLIYGREARRGFSLDQAREAELRAALRHAGVDALELATDADLGDAILRFADLRKRRSQLAAGGSLPQHLRLNREVPVA